MVTNVNLLNSRYTRILSRRSIYRQALNPFLNTALIYKTI